ncbi:MAG: hypothetical protein LUE64_02890 [Candidatus Gastranaerophilales bacterium]|nr:hypothetical protein [Candidatus Gastranaerophilales bacterium]
MNDSYVNALNTQKASISWMNSITENLGNIYTPGYRENRTTFKTFLDSIAPDGYLKNTDQGKAIPGTSNENIFLEGQGYFVVRNEQGRLAYTRLGEFKFDQNGVYKAADGSVVQGYIMNDKGEVMAGTKSLNKEEFEKTISEGGSKYVPTTEIKLWIDPDNGKFLGKYDEFEIKGDGILYGKANNGQECSPLYKLAIMNFHNPQELFQYKENMFVETEASGRPVAGRGEIRSGLIELSNVDFKTNISYYQEAKLQMDLAKNIMSSYKDLLENAISLMG